MNILVTGGCGFIGSHFIETILDYKDVECIINVDCMTYAANKTLPFSTHEKYHHFDLDISRDTILPLLKSFKIDYVIHFAAESHVDNSITNSDSFIQTNVVGTHNILKDLLQYTSLKKFIHVSTDEVFGSLGFKDDPFTVNSPYRPNSPYAASKASSDLLVRSYVNTYKLPAIITNCSNNFGPRQFTEKMIPLCINKLMTRQPIPLYGDGSNVRDWIYVKDHVNALIEIMLHGIVGKQYLIGGECELTNLDLITMLKVSYEHLIGCEDDCSDDGEWFKRVSDRKGHDLRYAIDTTEFREEFPDFKLSPFPTSIYDTIRSYL